MYLTATQVQILRVKKKILLLDSYIYRRRVKSSTQKNTTEAKFAELISPFYSSSSFINYKLII